MRKRLIIHQYKKHESLFDDICFYCGDFGNTKDHIPAVSCDIDINDVERIIVRSCVLCNSLLGNRYLNELLHRCDYLLIKYQKRFKKHLSLPFWTDAEVDELSGRLRRTVIVGLKKKKYVENKLKNIQQRIFELQGY